MGPDGDAMRSDVRCATRSEMLLPVGSLGSDGSSTEDAIFVVLYSYDMLARASNLWNVTLAVVAVTVDGRR